MKKRNIALMAIMGMLSGFTSNALSAAVDPSESRDREEVELARSGCGSKCGGKDLKASEKGRYGQPMKQNDEQKKITEKKTTGSSSCSGKTGYNGKNGKNMQNKRNNI